MTIEYEIRRLIKDYPSTLDIFEKLLTNKELEKWYYDAEEISRVQKVNRHDKLHALTVVKYSLQMFDILKREGKLKIRGPSIPGMKPFENSLIIILVSSYCHDICRGFPSHSEKALSILTVILRGLGFSDAPLDGLFHAILHCTEKHGGDRKADFQEEGILMLADGADCTKDRTQPSLNDFDALRSLSAKKSPIHYFSCKAIRNVRISAGTTKRPLLFSFEINGGAAAFHLEDFIKRLGNSTIDNITKVHVVWKKRKILIWPSHSG